MKINEDLSSKKSSIINLLNSTPNTHNNSKTIPQSSYFKPNRKMTDQQIREKDSQLLFQTNAIFFCPFNKTYTILSKDDYTNEEILEHIKNYNDNNFFLIQKNQF